MTYAWGPASDSAKTVAPGGGLNESKCHWNHGPSDTSSGRWVRVGSHPISVAGPRNDAAAENSCQQLAAEADGQVGHVRLRSGAEQLDLAAEPRNRVVEGCELGAERHDHRVVPRVDGPLLDVDAEDVDVRPALGEPLEDQAGRRRLLMLDHEGREAAVRGAHPGSPAGTG